VEQFPRFDLDGSVALVTGAARGIGHDLALALANAGADVGLGLRDASTGHELVHAIEAMGRRAVPLQMDVTRLDEVNASVKELLAQLGRIDVLVNNAGLGPENPAEKVTEADFDLTCAVNLKGTFFVSQAVGREMIRQGAGRIINLSSQAGFVALEGESVYCMTKAAIAHLTRCLAIEWGRYGVTVNGVAPTFIATPGTADVLEDPVSRAEIEEQIAGLHKVGQPMDVAGAVIYLASSAADLVTGHTILVDGGWTAR
jgi:NAD(P)-dependent dehydrogenase (short-subunit alcohol dehydrogenase family)